MVTMFFTVSVVNNYALNLNIAMPLHMIFRSVSAAGSQCVSEDAWLSSAVGDTERPGKQTVDGLLLFISG